MVKKICVIFDAFQNDADGYIPKKCSFFNISTGAICTYFIEPPFPWEMLHPSVRDVNSFIGRYILGTSWYSGEISFDRFMMLLFQQADSAEEIYTKGPTCVRYLSQLLGRIVFDIENIMREVPAHTVDRLKKDLPKMNCMMMDHKRKNFTPGFDLPEYSCCQNRAYLYGHVVIYYLEKAKRRENINRGEKQAI